MNQALLCCDESVSSGRVGIGTPFGEKAMIASGKLGWTSSHLQGLDYSSTSTAPVGSADDASSEDILSGGSLLNDDPLIGTFGVGAANGAAVCSYAPTPSYWGLQAAVDVFSAPQAMLPSSAFAAGSALASPYYIVPITSGGITLNLEFVLADHPTAAFEANVENAARLLAAAIHDPITVNIKIGYGEVDGGITLTNGAAAANPDQDQLESYSSVRAALLAHAAPGDTNFNALPTGSSIGGQSQVQVWNAELKLFGLLAANDTSTDDGYAGFATDIPDSLMVGVALHELTHALGRVADSDGAPDIFDFFRFVSAGTHLFGYGQPIAPAAYFSVDGGHTKLADYGQNSDPSDFVNAPSSALTPNDPLNEYYDIHTLQNLTQVDLTQLDVLGFNTAAAGPHIAPSVSAQNFVVSVNESVSVSSYFTVSNLSGDVIQYAFEDFGGGSGHFSVGGIAQADGQIISVSASSLSSVQYFGGTSPGSDTLKIGVHDLTTNSYDWSSPVVATTTGFTSGALIDGLTTDQQLELIYVGYFNRVPDVPGFQFWEGQLTNAEVQGQSVATAMTNIANAFAPQLETDALYPILTPGVTINPNSISDQFAVQTLVQNVYQNLFDRSVTTAELTSHQNAGYWVDEILNGTMPLGKAILAIANGAQNSDAAVLSDKIAVSNYWLVQTESNNIGLTAPVSSSVLTEAKAVLSGVTAGPATVASADVAIDSFIAADLGHAAGPALIEAVGLSTLNHAEMHVL
jgi:hypothetical protein